MQTETADVMSGQMSSVCMSLLMLCCLQVVATFQRMRQEQRSMASKAAELEMDINEHRLAALLRALKNTPYQIMLPPAVK